MIDKNEQKPTEFREGFLCGLETAYGIAAEMLKSDLKKPHGMVKKSVENSIEYLDFRLEKVREELRELGWDK